MLEQCENLNEVELFLETKTYDGVQHKDANYIMAILDSRKKFVAHERFQYVLLKKFGETDQDQQVGAMHRCLLKSRIVCISFADLSLYVAVVFLNMNIKHSAPYKNTLA